MSDQTPGRDFARLDFDSALDGFVADLRGRLPNWRETDGRDPLMALARMVAWLAHREASISDLVAGELAWPTLRRRRSAVSMARLMGAPLAAASPAETMLLLDLVSPPVAGGLLLPSGTSIRTNGDADSPSVPFEYIGSDVVEPAPDLWLAAEQAPGLVGPSIGTLAVPWPAPPSNGDTILIGHQTLVFDAVRLEISSPGPLLLAVEIWNGRETRRSPDDVSGWSGTLRFVVDTLLGVDDDRTGLFVHVRSRRTGLEAIAPVTWDGAHHVVTISDALGEAAPSGRPGDYEVSADWLPWAGVQAVSLDGVEAVIAGEQPWDLSIPWGRHEVGGVLAYWLRLRVVDATGPVVQPSSISATVPADGIWALPAPVVQGRTVVDRIGVTTGEPFQRLSLREHGLISGSVAVVEVGPDPEWIVVPTLLVSGPQDRHVMLEERPDGGWELVFGDGVTGALPATGRLVTVTYRVDATDDGNVGRDAIRVIDGSLPRLRHPRNPLDASGWRPRDADDTTALEATRTLVPSRYRARGRVTTPQDIEAVLTGEFNDSTGQRPFTRAYAVEDGAGYNTVRIVLVAPNDTPPSSADLADADQFLNGVRSGMRRVGGVLLANRRAVLEPMVQRVVDVSIHARVGRAYSSGARASIEAAVMAAVRPTAVDSTGAYRWEPGQEITDGAIVSAIGAAGIPGIIDLGLVGPGWPVQLGISELPVLGLLTIAITEV